MANRNREQDFRTKTEELGAGHGVWTRFIGAAIIAGLVAWQIQVHSS